MTTIAQLPAVTSVGASDLLPLSQAGLLYSVSVSQLTANLQPLISVPTGDLLGRQSIGAGGPESIAVGTGLALSAGALAANGGDHAGFPVQSAMSLSDELVINTNNAPGLLAVTALRGLFSAGTGVAIDGNGVITVTASAIAGPAGPVGPSGAVGPVGPADATGPAGSGLAGPAAGNSASSIGASDYVALWQNGALAWMPYGQFLGGQTIDQLPAAGPVSDSDELLVAQGSNTLSVQSFGAIWTYVQDKLPNVQQGVVELTANTVLDSTDHNNRILVASAAITLTANFTNMGPGFSCTLINLAPGAITMGTGISSGSGSTSLPPGAATTLVGLSYSGGSLVWWSGVVPNAPTLTVGSIVAPAADTPFSITGGVFNDAPTALDYSTDGGATWIAATGLVITANAYSFSTAGLGAGTYSIRVRDHANIAILGVSNSFTVDAPTVSLGAVPGAVPLNTPIAVSGMVFPADSAVQVGLSTSTTIAPTAWVNAVVSNGDWMASLTPSAAGTVYVWAEQEAAPAVFAVSNAVSVVTASIVVSAPASGAAGAGLNITGTVSPVADAVNVQLATQNTVAPTSGWTAATSSDGSFTSSLIPAAGGTYYAWAQDADTGLSAVSSAIVVAAAPALVYGINNPGGTYVHGVSVIGLNGSVTPPQNIATQIALSTSNTVVPISGWAAASIIYSNSLWAIYYTTPTTAGTYYVWVETATGDSPTVSTFTIQVT
jgi:hypothetical protein